MVKVFDELVGQTFYKVESPGDVMIFHSNKKSYMFYHRQNCCENVYIDDICGDLKDLENTPILMAEEVDNDPRLVDEKSSAESYTWTFYKFATIKGYVTVRWYGESNGCYSERVDFEEITNG